MKTSQWPTADGRYYVESCGNGWAYQVTCQQTGESFWVQDSDAIQLQEDTQDFTCTDGLENYFVE